MRKSYFVETCQSFDDLMGFSFDEGYEFEDLWYKEDYDEWVLEALTERVSDAYASWRDISTWLNGLPQEPYFLYYKDGVFYDAVEYYDLLYDEFVSMMDSIDRWDPEYEDEECEYDEEVDFNLLNTDESIQEAGCELSELFESSILQMTINN